MWKIAHEKNINTHINNDFTSKVYLTIKTSASPEACIVEHPYSNKFWLGMLITFCLFSEYARNSSIFDLNGVYSVNNTFFSTALPARLNVKTHNRTTHKK
jgi:hypothetical protein